MNSKVSSSSKTPRQHHDSIATFIPTASDAHVIRRPAVCSIEMLQLPHSRPLQEDLHHLLSIITNHHLPAKSNVKKSMMNKILCSIANHFRKGRCVFTLGWYLLAHDGGCQSQPSSACSPNRQWPRCTLRHGQQIAQGGDFSEQIHFRIAFGRRRLQMDKASGQLGELKYMLKLCN